MIKHFAFTFLLVLSMTGVLRAQDERASIGLASNGLCGLGRLSAPVCPERIGLSVSSGYGYTESLGPVDGAHHRVTGVLGVGVVPLPWLALALQLDGRIDVHPRDERGKNITGTGDPRLFVRAGKALGHGLSLGGEGVLWVPGNDAPSFDMRATTLDLKALLAWRMPTRPLTLLTNLGMRIDQSAHTAPDLTRLRAGDRIALGLSDAHAVLVGVGASGRVHARGELFGELSLDVLVGEDAPSFSRSPMRATLGGRIDLPHALTGELSTTVSFQQRPGVSASDPLVPIEPRFSLALGLRYGRALHPPKPAPPVVEEEIEGPPLPTSATLIGTLVDEQGTPLPDVRVVLRMGELTRETITDGAGRYTFADVPLGRASLESSGTGFETTRFEVTVTPNMAPLVERQLAAKSDAGTLRILTRSFRSEPVAASVLVRDARGKKAASGQANAQGLYELELPPGDYVVSVSAPGYRAHRREVRIERYGVAILNVDLHPLR